MTTLLEELEHLVSEFDGGWITEEEVINIIIDLSERFKKQ